MLREWKDFIWPARACIALKRKAAALAKIAEHDIAARRDMGRTLAWQVKALAERDHILRTYLYHRQRRTAI